VIPIKLSKEQKDDIVKRLQSFFEEERQESIGNLAAERIIDFMLKEVGPYIYNKAIADARLMISEKAAQIEDELYAMEKPVMRSR